MAAIVTQRADIASPSNVFLSCSQTLHHLIADLARQVRVGQEHSENPLEDDWPESWEVWQNSLANTTVKHVVEASGAQWAFIHLCDPVTRELRPGASAGLENADPDGWLYQCLDDLGRATLAAAHPIRIGDLPSDKRHIGLAQALPCTPLLWAIPLIGSDGKAEGAVALGFEKGQKEPFRAEIEMLAKAGRHVGATLRAYRRLASGLAEMQEESDRAAGEKSWQVLPPHDVGLPAAVSVAVSSESGAAAATDYCAAATSRRGDIRLFIARLGGQGLEMAWETLALDAAFRAACAMSRDPSETATIMGHAWMGVGSNLGSVRHTCCMDVAESGREYVFAGSASHLHYENRGQTIAELYERLADIGAGAVWDGQHVGLHSGDIVILHTCSLPVALPNRHDVHRRLAAILAREGRQPLETLVGQVAALLHNGCADCAPASVLALVRAE